MKNRFSFLLILSLLSYVKLFAQAEEVVPVQTPPDKIYRSLESALQNPDSVYRLDLSRRKLKEIPAGVFKLKNLYELDVSRNRLKSVPAEIGTLTNLKILNASNNNLEGLPPEIGKLVFLQRLELNRNLITTLPPQIGQLTELQTLELWDNEIDSIPDEIKNLKQLKVLELRGILFTEEDQSKIRNLLPECKIYFSPSCLCKD